jgi:Phage protein (N4 Gp49/phage Sf6 gene 66) family
MQNLTTKTATTTTSNNLPNEATMNSLLTEVLQWLHNNGYRRASFDRIIGIVPSASTYEQLTALVNHNDDIFRATTIKGGLPGLAVQDGITVADALLIARGGTEEEAEPMTIAPTPAPPAWITVTNPVPPVASNPIDFEVEYEYYRNLGSALKAPVGSTAYNTTLCVLILRNGFVIVGKSACVNSENFNEEVGKQLAREDALRQIKPFMGWREADRRLVA